ncbi:ribosomal protein l20 domain-containing protein [Ditylenchus destructor]|uniref:Ribosomal protein l20 domain-containing protein n=1 Tax=Ditylenchus destructor TaxID=166010 RepID=A0AAD4ND86_9BILA|nr:ribosomal protein l20 domain-containing protein [Ditylenchus destructor]
MRLTEVLGLRRILNSSYHPFHVIPKPSKWMRRERLKRLMAWQTGTARDCVKASYRQLNKVFHYMDMERQDEPKLELYHSAERLKSALAEHNAEYKTFKNMLDMANILLDKRVLAHLAIYEPLTFKSLVDLTQRMAMEQGRLVYPTEEELDHVHTESSLFGEVIPHAKIFPRGPAENHQNRPQKLKLKEF